MELIFIVGCMRTGSKIYMSILDYSPIDIVQEIHFLNPPWLHSDFVRRTQKLVGLLSDDRNLAKLIDLMYSGAYYGSFWKNIDLDRRNLERRILTSDRSFKSILESILREHAHSRRKKICGAKFPVHFSYVPTLLKWFPECKIIHLVRDPRAIFSSLLIRHTGNRQSKIVYLYVPLLIHTVIQFVWSFRVYDRYKDLHNYFLARYEDIITKPRENIRRLCDFLQVRYSESMLNIPVRDSSYGPQEDGISKMSMHRWKKEISPITSKLILLLTKKQMKLLGYL